MSRLIIDTLRWIIKTKLISHTQMQALLGPDLFPGAALIQSSIIPCTCGFKMQKQLKRESLEILLLPKCGYNVGSNAIMS